MAEQDAAILHEMRDAILRLNDALKRASRADLDVDLDVVRQSIVGRRSQMLTITGRATRSRLELDERL